MYSCTQYTHIYTHAYSHTCTHTFAHLHIFTCTHAYAHYTLRTYITHAYTHMQTFFSNLEESTIVDKTLVKRGLQFRENLTKKYKWDFSSEPEDYAPTIVET